MLCKKKNIFNKKDNIENENKKRIKRLKLMIKLKIYLIKLMIKNF